MFDPVCVFVCVCVCVFLFVCVWAATLAVLRAKIEKQKQVAQATKASLPSSSNQDQRGFQALPKCEW